MFTQTSYYRHKFKDLILEQTPVAKISFEQCHFHRCQLLSLTLKHCQFIDCTFADCVLSAIKPEQSAFTDTRFTRCKVIGFDWTLAESVTGLSFLESDLSLSNFAGLKLPRSVIKNSKASEVHFAEADFRQSDFSGTDFDQAIFHHTNLEKTDFTDATNYALDIRTNPVKGARFTLPQAINLLRVLDIRLDS